MNKALIISVGGTAEPLNKTILYHKPSYVCFLASQATNSIAAKICEDFSQIEPHVRFEFELVDNENDLKECHTKALKCIERTKSKAFSKSSILVDYTGGTKNMSVALALAAVDEGYEFSYVGGEVRTKNGIGIVQSGYETVYTHINPWDFLAIKERRHASILFNTYQFKACQSVLLWLVDNASKQRTIYKKLASVVDAFYQWDLFRHTKAQELLKKKDLAFLCDCNDSQIASFANSCIELPAKLEIITEKSKQGKVPCSEIAHDLYANAERRFKEGKTDDAILRLYRLVEMVAQKQLLHNYLIDTGNVHLESIPENIREDYCKKYKDSKNGRIQVPQNASYILLKELNDPLGIAYEKNLTSIRNIQSSRNESYLAHGFKSSQESLYLNLKKFILELGNIDTCNITSFPELNL